MTDKSLNDILEDERSTGRPFGLEEPRLKEDGDPPFKKLNDGDKP